MDALAAVGLASNIIQFISFSYALISKSKEIHRSASGLSDESIDLVIVSKDIRRLGGDVLSNHNPSDKHKSPDKYSSSVEHSSSGSLSRIAQRCDGIAQEILQAISQVQAKQKKPGHVPTRWQTFRMALRCVWSKNHIDDLKSRLELLRDQMTIILVSNTSDNQSRLMHSLELWRTENAQAGYRTTEQIRALDIKLDNTRNRIQEIHGDEHWAKLRNEFTQISSKVHQLSQCHTIITSLRYECMEVRQDAIKEAHKRTFDWIYSPCRFSTSNEQFNVGFAEWLQYGTGTYWITGKPGSGKSTLMKFLYDHCETIRNLGIWSGGTPLVRASFYFWNPGQEMQKSLEGLLQTLLYHILHACPDLAPIICSKRWNEDSQAHVVGPAKPWTFSELKKSLDAFRFQPPVDYKFYFQIDGLDEYYGDTFDVIDILKDLSATPGVKICLSSRPLNCFQDAFGTANPDMLRLHDLTREDIELFARENLVSYSKFTDSKPATFDELVRDIGDRAQGVFLWVRLVVRSLRDGIINEDPISILQERLRAIPTDLELFFEHILASVEDIYRGRMANTFLIALRTACPLNIIRYYFLDQDDTNFGLHAPHELWSPSKIQNKVVQTQRRLNGRFKGLLEPTSTAGISYATKVDFLHRTLRDFLLTLPMKYRLESWASADIDRHAAMSRAIIAEMKFIWEYPSPSELKLALELAKKVPATPGKTDYCSEATDQVGLAAERIPSGESTLDVVRSAASIGHAGYIRYKLRKESAILNLNHILKHTVECLAGRDVAHYLALYNGTYDRPKDWFVRCIIAGVGNTTLPLITDELVSLGATPSTVIGGTSIWETFLGLQTKDMDGEQKEQYRKVLEIFRQKAQVNITNGDIAAIEWHTVLGQPNRISTEGLQNTLRYLKGLFCCGIRPTTITQGTTIFQAFLKALSEQRFSLPDDARDIQCRILREFLRHGTDVSHAYDMTSSGDWFKSVLQQLRNPFNTTCLSSRTQELRILLDHGLDPNANVNGRHTVWEQLLEAIELGTLHHLSNRTHHRTICDIILDCLQFGADPHVSRLQNVLSWMKSRSSSLTSAEVKVVERAVETEIAQMEAHILPLNFPEAYRGYGPDSASFSNMGLLPEYTWDEAGKGRKRKNHQTHHTERVPYSKHRRFNE